MPSPSLRSSCCALLLALTAHATPTAVTAAAAPARDRLAEERLAERLRFLGTHSEVAVERAAEELAALWRRAADPARSGSERQADARELLERWIELHGAEGLHPQGPPAALLAGVDGIVGMEAPDVLQREPTDRPLGRATVRPGEGEPVVLIEGRGADPLAPLADRLGEHRPILRVALTGLDGGAALPLPERRRFTDLAWTRRFQTALEAKLGEEGWDRVALVGHDLGALVALDFTIRSPERVRSLVLVDPPNPPNSFSRERRGQLATVEERRQAVEATLLPLLPGPTEEERFAAVQAFATSNAIDPEVAVRQTRARTAVEPLVVGRWLNETATMDLEALVGQLRRPTALFLSLADEGSVLWTSPWLTGLAWGRAAAAHPDAPFRIVPFDDVRSAPLDAPLQVARAVEDHLAGRAVTGTPHDPARAGNPASRYFLTRTGIGFTEVEIEGYAPKRNGRELWGGVVPWDQVWRAGANETTRVTFSRDVEVGGAALAAGTYAFFVIPRQQGPWTAIFHAVPWGFGAFGYHEEHDALRIDIEPRTAASHAEHLEFRLDGGATGRGELVMAWGDRELALGIVAPAGLQWIEPVPAARWTALAGWRELGTDAAGDAANAPVLHDGVALSAAYECDADTVWLRFDLASAPSTESIGLNVAVDTDRDQGTGMAWFGPNSGFTFDRLLTIWVSGAEGRFAGTVGGAEYGDAAVGSFTTLFEDGLELGVANDALYLGVAADRLDDDGRMDLVATVGTHLFWNDDLVDEGSVPLDVVELRRERCR